MYTYDTLLCVYNSEKKSQKWCLKKSVICNKISREVRGKEVRVRIRGKVGRG